MNSPVPPPGRPVIRTIRPLHDQTWAEIARPRALAPVMETTVIATDIMEFGKRYRDAGAQVYVRHMLYELLFDAFDITGVSWWDCYREDRGDGVLIVAPPDIEPDRFLDPLIHHLNALLRCYTRRAGELAELRLRMAIHFGYVYHDAHGVTGHALTHLFRLLEAPAFKKAVADTEAKLGAIVSDHLYTEAAQHVGLMNPAGYTPLQLRCKETRSRAWLWLPAESRSRSWTQSAGDARSATGQASPRGRSQPLSRNLYGAKPPVWRRLEIPSAMPLAS